MKTTSSIRTIGETNGRTSFWWLTRLSYHELIAFRCVWGAKHPVGGVGELARQKLGSQFVAHSEFDLLKGEPKYQAEPFADSPGWTLSR